MNWVAGCFPSRADVTSTLSDAALSSDEQRILDELAKMLPRAAELLPQFIGQLRETQLSLQSVAERINKDGTACWRPRSCV